MIISRNEARARGLVKYFSGEQCHRGHVSERYVISGNCIACARAIPPPVTVSLKGETWLSVPAFEGMYEISDRGRVRSLARTVEHARGDIRIQPRLLHCNVEPTGTGYCYVFLSKAGKPKRFRVHSLVLIAFCGPCPPGLECRHLDGNPQNNNVKNLVWGTHAQNTIDMIAHNGAHTMRRHFKLTARDVDHIRRMKGRKKQKDLAKQFGVSTATIANVHQGKTYRSLP